MKYVLGPSTGHDDLHTRSSLLHRDGSCII